MIFENCFTKTSLYYFFLLFPKKLIIHSIFRKILYFVLRNEKGPVFFLYLFLDESKQKWLNIKML